MIRILGNFGKLTQGFKWGGGAVAKCVSGPQGRSPENFWYFSMCVDHFVRAIVIQYKFLPLFLIFCTLRLVTVVVHEIDICNKFQLEKHNRKRAPTIRVFQSFMSNMWCSCHCKIAERSIIKTFWFLSFRSRFGPFVTRDILLRCCSFRKSYFVQWDITFVCLEPS